MVTPAASYDGAFYAHHAETSRRSADQVLGYLFEHLAVTSVLDIGCGRGHWLASAQQLGVSSLLGIDGPWVDQAALAGQGIPFLAADIGSAIPAGERFDLVLCVEVAEHLPGERADSLVQELCDRAGMILFSAAIPHQGGTGHVNERYPSWWAERFHARGFVPLDVIRPRFWNDDTVGWWYRQNMFLYVPGERHDALANRFGVHATPAMDVVHPENYERKMAVADERHRRHEQRERRPTMRQVLGSARRWLRNRLSVFDPGH